MKKILASLFLAAFAMTISAQEPISTDSCYVYTYLHWQNEGYRAFGGKLQLNPKGEDQPIINDDGEVIEFASWPFALNYLVAQGWEFVSIDDTHPDTDHSTTMNPKDRFILIRKMTQRDEALKYAEPKPTKKKK